MAHTWLRKLTAKFDRTIHRVQLAHALHSVALSFVGIYVPVFLLTHGFSLIGTIFFFIIFHLIGLALGLTLCPFLMRRWGLVQTLRLSYPIQIVFFITLNLMPTADIPWYVVASLGGMSTFLYWMPLNILLVKYADEKKMGSDMGIFFALPKIFGVAGPLISALLIPFFGFWPMFIVSGIGLLVAYTPLIGLQKESLSVDFKFSQAIEKIKKRKLLFFLEGFDNIIEESEWFWGIFVFLAIGSLSAPGIVGGLESLGGALFALLVGKHANKSALKLIPLASIGLIILWISRFFIESPLSAYLITIVTSFVMTLFLVSYFSLIYKNIKNDDEETFLILREIPTVIGRMIVFGSIILVASYPKQFFILPIATILFLMLLLFIKRKKLLAI
jgi:MFS family permease